MKKLLSVIFLSMLPLTAFSNPVYIEKDSKEFKILNHEIKKIYCGEQSNELSKASARARIEDRMYVANVARVSKRLKKLQEEKMKIRFSKEYKQLLVASKRDPKLIEDAIKYEDKTLKSLEEYKDKMVLRYGENLIQAEPFISDFDTKGTSVAKLKQTLIKLKNDINAHNNLDELIRTIESKIAKEESKINKFKKEFDKEWQDAYSNKDIAEVAFEECRDSHIENKSIVIL